MRQEESIKQFIQEAFENKDWIPIIILCAMFPEFKELIEKMK